MTARSPGQPPEPPRQGEDESRIYAKRRLPFDTTGAARHPGVTAAAILYAVATIGCFGLAGYMAFVAQRELVSVPVLAPLGGGLYFIVRLLMVLRPRLTKE
jgi:hypothetical protein